MDDDPKFTRGWRVAIVVALFAAFGSGSAASKWFQEKDRQDEKRMAKMEKSIAAIESYLYENVAGSEQRTTKKIRDLEERIGRDKVAE